jgi:hypothetical protein
MGGSITMFPKAQQHHALAALSGLCPVLREVQFGFPGSNWKRSGRGELWRLRLDGSAVRVVE